MYLQKRSGQKEKITEHLRSNVNTTSREKKTKHREKREGAFAFIPRGRRDVSAYHSKRKEKGSKSKNSKRSRERK